MAETLEEKLRTFKELLLHPDTRYSREPLLKMVETLEEELRTLKSIEQAKKGNALLAIVVGGLSAGSLDLTQACILFGWKIPLTIAAGLLGRQALHGGVGIYVLGVLLHFFIAFSVTAIYYAASRRLLFLIDHPLVCGLFYGIAVELVMNLVVLPLSALHARGPYKLHNLILGLVVHMVVVGLPVSFSVRYFAKRGDDLPSQRSAVVF